MYNSEICFKKNPPTHVVLQCNSGFPQQQKNKTEHTTMFKNKPLQQLPMPPALEVQKTAETLFLFQHRAEMAQKQGLSPYSL